MLQHGGGMDMSKPGRQNLEQTSEQLAKQKGKNDVEFSADEFQVGNSQSQSQKKSGKQKNKK
ncbi:hypothetical protein [Bacillus salacetis]|uniref:hypothetical protein n=1 Tax=Bacillus salacetis TaxID=2315464 RepID=UPI001444501A|nr:hypothetical protein [Bacillus salacetis]